MIAELALLPLVWESNDSILGTVDCLTTYLRGTVLVGIRPVVYDDDDDDDVYDVQCSELGSSWYFRR